MSGAAEGNRYEYPNGVLRNLFGITDEARLQQIEASFTVLRLGELTNHPIAEQFDLVHLQDIHHALVQDVYDWAGEIRQVEISKGTS